MKKDERIGAANHHGESGAAPTNDSATDPSNGAATGVAAIETMMEDTEELELIPAPENGEGEKMLEAEIEKPKKDFRRRTLLKELEQKEIELEKGREENTRLADQYTDLKDRHLRLAAEMENSRKRLEREYNNRAESKVADLLAELLPVVDDMERMFGASAEAKDYEALMGGAKLIHQNVQKILQTRGVTAMETLDQVFDPTRHEALLQMPVDGKAPNLVVQENKKGYLFAERVLRPAQVIVSA